MFCLIFDNHPRQFAHYRVVAGKPETALDTRLQRLATLLQFGRAERRLAGGSFGDDSHGTGTIYSMGIRATSVPRERELLPMLAQFRR